MKKSTVAIGMELKKKTLLHRYILVFPPLHFSVFERSSALFLSLSIYEITYLFKSFNSLWKNSSYAMDIL